MKHQIVDARGLACPQPVIKAKKALEAMSEGTLEVLVDNEIAVQNLMKFGGYYGSEPVWEMREEGEYRVVFSVTGESDPNVRVEEKTKESQGAGEEEGEENTSAPSNCRKGQVVVISSDSMGTGSDDLGRILMKGFLYALTQLDQLPETVILYNGGAVLSKEGEQSAEDLRVLMEQGVKILTCGTCIDYYGLPSKPAVGGVTNLYDMAIILSGARSIIRP